MLVDADLWLCLLDVACLGGWRPKGTREPDAALVRARGSSSPWEQLAYFLPCGQRMDGADLRELARCASVGLEFVSDTEVPLRGRTFGEENTLALLRLAAAGQDIPRERAEGALELLSGPPKEEARVLLRYLRGGHVTIRPDLEAAR